MELAIKQVDSEVFLEIKAAAAKRGVRLNFVAQKVGLRYDVFVRKLKANYIDFSFIESVSLVIHEKTKVTVKFDKKTGRYTFIHKEIEEVE